ncbi:hypothetical protein ABFX02_13G000700 [Erythranthe guttata]
MSSSEEEGEIVPDYVSDYYFEDSEGEPISFSCLPLQWNENKGEQKLDSTKYAFLHGMVEDGHQLIYRKVIAWKFILSYALPEIYALLDAKSERWIKLQKPRKSYEDTIRSILISVHCLHFIKKNPEEESGEALWKNIRRTFSTYEVPPSEDDLLDHMQWIKEAVIWDKDIARAKNLHTFLSEISGKRKALCEENRIEKKPKFIVQDDEDIHNHDDLSDTEQDELFDCVCAFCDDGGDLLGCEGRCIRSFHPTIESGAASACESLCYSSEQLDAIQTFLCKNCQYQQHQCFICGRLGSSDKSFGAKVFACVSATCGHFYHPRCISELVFPGNENQAREFQKQIEAGDSFTCPAHKCYVCKQGEDKNVDEMQFAVCRRCPKAYHRKCLPRNIYFQRNDVKDIPQRAWEGLLTKRILIYCMDHKICRNTLTPKRDHVVFPCVDRKTEQEKLNVISVKRSNACGILKDETKGESSKNFAMSEGRKPNKPSTMEKTKLPWRSDQSLPMPSVKKVPPKSMVENIPSGSTRAVRTAEMEKRIQRLIENSTSSLNVEEFLDEQRRKCTHVLSPHYKVEKTITMGKIECSVQAIQEALKILQEGGTVKDAKAVCEPAVLSQIVIWKKKMGAYLAPFIHGMRYTSFGRHFTKVDKLKQVVNRLCWYVQHGDTIVDFCCGSNDFNCLMKEELDRMGIQCSFKNYDLIQPKNDFNFEKRDWMSVQLEELPEGSKLIMGLNPPFGMHASLANQFIGKALKFRPKLLILIVPKETKSLVVFFVLCHHRLDRKKTPYDLVWEDDQILSGKSFYLPGSVDVHDQQMEQWNLSAPPLYLWSRPDWTAKHRQVALEHGHLIKKQNTEYSNYLMEENQDCYGDFSSVADGYSDINCILEDLPEPSDDV